MLSSRDSVVVKKSQILCLVVPNQKELHKIINKVQLQKEIRTGRGGRLHHDCIILLLCQVRAAQDYFDWH